MKILILICFACSLWAKDLGTFLSAGKSFKAEVLTELDDVIWGFDFLPDGKILITQRSGEIFIFQPKIQKAIRVKGGPKVVARGQGGLLDIAIHPNFKENAFIFLSYAKKVGSKYTTAIARAKWNGKSLENLKDIFVAKPAFSTTHHYGSRIVFPDEEHLFFSVGDRGNRDLAQSLSTDNGKIHRIRINGKIPKDNPFVSNKKARPSIWSYGHRNPQGLALHPATKELWEQEHGPRGGDEINLIKKGKNYGWPIITYGREYHGPKIGKGITKKKGMEQPVYYYVPSIAPSGFAIYSGDLFKHWQNSFFSGALALQHLNRLDLNKPKKQQEERLLSNLNYRVRNVKVSADGYLYISTDNSLLIRLLPQ